MSDLNVIGTQNVYNACPDPSEEWLRDEYFHPVVPVACLTFDSQETVPAKSTNDVLRSHL